MMHKQWSFSVAILVGLVLLHLILQEYIGAHQISGHRHALFSSSFERRGGLYRGAEDINRTEYRQEEASSEEANANDIHADSNPGLVRELSEGQVGVVIGSRFDRWCHHS